MYEPYTVSNSKFWAIIIAILLSNKLPGFHKHNIKHFQQKSTNLINTKFTEGCIPITWKLAEVVPHLQRGEREMATNNRPFSHYNYQPCPKLLNG